VDGSYDALNRVHDDIIRGDDAGDGAAIAPRLHVHSAGNYGKQPAVGNQRGFFSLNNQLKNALSVGNYYSAESRIASSSSLGPTYDGRIKPDVVAPGTFVTALGYCTATDNPPYIAMSGGSVLHPCNNRPTGASFPRRNFYWQQTGTSAAAAVVSGVMAIVAGQLATTPNITLNPAAPLPSTLRAIAVHSAKDLTFALETQDGADQYLSVQAFAGPDFATGFGLIDAKAAIDVVSLRAVREDVIDATCATKTYTMNIPDDDYLLTVDGKIRITLAWDDPASDTPEIDSHAPRLINDLDVVLTAPDGTKYYPWLLDQQPVDTDGNTLGNDAQTCGMDVQVLRKLKATTVPHYIADGNPMNVDDPITIEDVQPATTGKDHLNNVEQVSAPSMPGQWTIEVSGFNVDQGPQKFSLIGVPAPEINIHFEPRKFCQKFPMLCELRFALACIRFPLLCERPFLITMRSDTLPITFRDAADMRVIPIPALCNALGRYASCGGARNDQPRPPLDVTLVSGAEALRTEVLDARGHLLASDTTAAPSKRLHIPASRYPTFLVLTPKTGRPGTEVLVPISLRQSR